MSDPKALIRDHLEGALMDAKRGVKSYTVAPAGDMRTQFEQLQTEIEAAFAWLDQAPEATPKCDPTATQCPKAGPNLTPGDCTFPACLSVEATPKGQQEPSEFGYDLSPPTLIQWLRNKYARHKEIEDKLAADLLERLVGQQEPSRDAEQASAWREVWDLLKTIRPDFYKLESTDVKSALRAIKDMRSAVQPSEPKALISETLRQAYEETGEHAFLDADAWLDLASVPSQQEPRDERADREAFEQIVDRTFLKPVHKHTFEDHWATWQEALEYARAALSQPQQE